MLTKPMRKYVESETKTGYSKHDQTVYDGRLIDYSVQALKDFTLIAEKLPEEQQAKIFNEKNMHPLFQALFNLPDLKADATKEKRVEFEKRRERIIGLWDAMFKSGVMSEFYGMKLVSTDVWRALTLRGERALEAIYYVTLYRKPKRST